MYLTKLFSLHAVAVTLILSIPNLTQGQTMTALNVITNLNQLALVYEDLTHLANRLPPYPGSPVAPNLPQPNHHRDNRRHRPAANNPLLGSPAVRRPRRAADPRPGEPPLPHRADPTPAPQGLYAAPARCVEEVVAGPGGDTGQL